MNFAMTKLKFFVLAVASLCTGSFAVQDELVCKAFLRDRMPENIDVNFELNDRTVQMNLRKNRNVPSDAPIFVAENGKIERWDPTSELGFATYVDPTTYASIVVATKEDGETTVTSFRGSMTIDGNFYSIEPLASRQERSADDLVVNIRGVDHVMTAEKADLEFEELTEKLNSQFDNKIQEVLEQEELLKPRGGFQKYEVEMLLVLDYALYNRWFRVSKAADDTGKKNDAIQNLQFYFSHVVSGVDVRYANIKETDLSMNVRLVGYYVATTVADSSWTEKAGTKIIYKNRGFTDMYKALDSLEKWIPEAMPKLQVTFDQVTLFSGNDLFDGDYREDGSPSAKSGLAEIESICKLSKPRALAASVNRELGVYSSIQTAAHELAHNLGAQHDGSGNACSGKDQFVMASAPRVLDKNNFGNPFKFSSCSVAYFRKYLASVTASGKNCLLTSSSAPTVKAPPNFKPLPGIQYSVDLQCQNIFGSESFYCAGNSFDKKLCELMMCYIPWRKECQATAEQRAFDGTTCGNKKWCMDGKCVADPKASAAPDTCIYGDIKGIVGFDTSTKLTCADMGKQQPHRCYQPWAANECCTTCCKVRDKAKTGCEYGDRDPDYCKNKVTKTHCYTPEIAKTCCSTCVKLKENVQGCEFGDRAAWCTNALPHTCYDTNTTCCHSCKKFLQNTKGCEYGDRAPWCKTTALSKVVCDHANTRVACCAGCKKFPKDAEAADSESCKDHDKKCADIFPGWCSKPKTEKKCCKFCSAHKTGKPNCPYGDKHKWCKKEFCPKKAAECCATCAH